MGLSAFLLGRRGDGNDLVLAGVKGFDRAAALPPASRIRPSKTRSRAALVPTGIVGQPRSRPAIGRIPAHTFLASFWPRSSSVRTFWHRWSLTMGGATEPRSLALLQSAGHRIEDDATDGERTVLVVGPRR